MSADQNSEPCSQAICTACRKESAPLTGMDRQIAIQAIAAQAKGSPVEAAYQILAGIEALDHGPEGPLVVLWPRKDFLIGEEERAEWHRAESERLLASAAEFKQRWAMATKQGSSTQPESEPEGHYESPPPEYHRGSQELPAHQLEQCAQPLVQDEASSAGHLLRPLEPPPASSDV